MRYLICTAAVLAVSASSSATAQTHQDTAARVEALLARMTQDEKIGLLTTSMPAFSPRARALGAPVSAGINPGVPRLGVPALRESDASLGVANTREMRKGDTATALPSGLATASTFAHCGNLGRFGDNQTRRTSLAIIGFRPGTWRPVRQGINAKLLAFNELMVDVGEG